MKFVAPFILFCALAITWYGYKVPASVPVLTHYQLQNELKQYIAHYISEHQPKATRLLFYKFWTEPTNGREVRAVFEYSFDVPEESGEIATSRLKGYAFLTPIDGLKTWSLDHIEINNEVINFQNGSLISPETK